jgi:hypothetical protein
MVAFLRRRQTRCKHLALQVARRRTDFEIFPDFLFCFDESKTPLHMGVILASRKQKFTCTYKKEIEQGALCHHREERGRDELIQE